MIKKIADYEKRLKIEADDLNVSLLDQAETFWHVADEAERWASERDTFKYDLDKREAQLAQEFRRKAAANGDKLTENAVKEQITVHPEIIKLNEQLLDAKAEYGRWDALRDAFSKRSKMIELMVYRELRMLGDLSLERGTTITRQSLMEARSNQVTQARRSMSGKKVK